MEVLNTTNAQRKAGAQVKRPAAPVAASMVTPGGYPHHMTPALYKPPSINTATTLCLVTPVTNLREKKLLHFQRL